MGRFTLFLFSIFLISCKKDNLKINDKNTENGDQYYTKGEVLFQKDDIKSYENFQKAISYYKQANSFKDISNSLIYQANIQSNKGDYLGAEETLVEALDIIKTDDENLYSIYGTMSNIKSYQKDYTSSIEWCNKALSENINYQTKAYLLNNKAISLYKIKKTKEALSILNNIDLDSISSNNFKNTITENKEFVKWLISNSYPAEEKIEKILQAKTNEDDKWGMNSSFSHLAIINQYKNKEKSLLYSEKMLGIALTNKSPDDKLEAFERILLVDKPSNYIQNFKNFKNLSDSIQLSANDYNKKFAYIKYDSKKKEIENLKLQKDNAVKDFQFYSISIFSTLLTIFGVIWYRKRKQRMQLESENKLKEQQLKVSKKVHDVVANGIYQVMTKIENQDSFNKEQALDELEFVYEKSRDISYEKQDSPNQNFKEKISNLIASFKNEEVNTFIAGNDDQLWEYVSESTQTEIYQIIRELLVNMKKHSKASNVAFRFEKINNSINIYYTDNGIGISDELIFKNGLSNTVSRIDNINGKITFDTQTEKGLKINISFPFS